MQWDNSYSVNVAAFDSEHRQLFSLIDRLGAAMQKGKGKNMLSASFHELIDYTQTHFKHEEELMGEHSYPGLELQKKEHANFVAKVRQMLELHESDNTMLSVSIMNFLQSWLINHIKKTDKDYSDFFNEKGVV